MIALLVAGTACTSHAQDDDKKIRIKISREVDGETKTFEGEYDSEEEMLSDPNYQEFTDGDSDISIFFNGDDDFDRIFDLYSDEEGARAYSFSFGNDDDFMPLRKLKNFRFHHGGPNVWAFGDGDDTIIDLKSWDSEEYEEELAEKMEELEEKLKGVDKELREEIMDAMREIEEMQPGFGFPKRIKRSGISVEDVDDEFGKRGKVDSKDKLELDDLDFMIWQNRMTLKMRIKDEGELTVKIVNEDDKEIYNRYFERYGGTFSDNIDFSKYSDGNYLLEITLDKKRLTKKIVID